MKRPYNGPKELALRRHRKAKLFRAAWIVSIIIPAVLILTGGTHTPFWLVCIFLAAARFLFLESKGATEAALRAEKGGEAEDRVGEMLSALIGQGWSIEKNVLLPREGDIDFLVTSPNQKVFAVDVKSHSGVISDRDGRLTRSDKELERDLKAVILRQAGIISSQRHCGKVVPILAFTRARLELSQRTIDGVHVLKANRLVETLKELAAH
ncbi:NERD domain-containing protein [Candidatus Obscuribacterales bacterium]|nr:NERD domain-containing protein [Candidatus Obscuribacterales bacterium]